MKISSIIKGTAAFALVGTAVYLYSSSTPRTQKKIRKTTGKALHSASDAFDNVARMM